MGNAAGYQPAPGLMSYIYGANDDDREPEPPSYLVRVRTFDPERHAMPFNEEYVPHPTTKRLVDRPVTDVASLEKLTKDCLRFIEPEFRAMYSGKFLYLSLAVSDASGVCPYDLNLYQQEVLIGDPDFPENQANDMVLMQGPPGKAKKDGANDYNSNVIIADNKFPGSEFIDKVHTEEHCPMVMYKPYHWWAVYDIVLPANNSFKVRAKFLRDLGCNPTYLCLKTRIALGLGAGYQGQRWQLQIGDNTIQVQRSEDSGKKIANINLLGNEATIGRTEIFNDSDGFHVKGYISKDEFEEFLRFKEYMKRQKAKTAKSAEDGASIDNKDSSDDSKDDSKDDTKEASSDVVSFEEAKRVMAEQIKNAPQNRLLMLSNKIGATASYVMLGFLLGFVAQDIFSAGMFAGSKPATNRKAS